MTNFIKNPANPIYGGPSTGTLFDVLVTRDGGRYRMDLSWRPKKALAVAFSDDGVHWSEPEITLPCDPTTGWEDGRNRNCVIKVGDEWKMWYAAGETYEPNVLALATSTDGINWTKDRINPIFVKDASNEYERDRVGGCQVLRTGLGYLMFYIGYRDINTACICAALSPDGRTGWKRCKLNPLVTPTDGEWDADSCYKPSALYDNGSWRIWYNGRKKWDEYIGEASMAGDFTPDMF